MQTIGSTYTIRIDEGHVFVRRDGSFIARGEIRHTTSGVTFEGDALPSEVARAIDDALSSLTPRPAERDPAEKIREANMRRTVGEFVERFVRGEQERTRRSDGGRKSYAHLVREAEIEAYRNAERNIQGGGAR